MPVRGLLGGVITELGCRIVRGTYPVGSTLPIESELVAELGVSRSVVREAIRVLSAKSLVRSRQMDGTRVLPRNQWRHLDPDVIGWRMQSGAPLELLQDLMLVRLVLEPAIVRHATLHATAEQRDRVHDAWRDLKRVYTEPHESSAVARDAFIVADLEFHRALLGCIGSELLDQLFAVIEAALALLIDIQMQARNADRSWGGMDQRRELHAGVYEAFAAGEATGAENMMRALIEQAVDDSRTGFAKKRIKVRQTSR
jgi:GntR family transcriptional regulator, galactonate operon transcriptional repressor